MKIFDINDVELQEENLDLELGHLEFDRIFKERHEATEEIPEVKHYEIDMFYLTDGSSYKPESMSDPHIEVIDADAGKFEFNDLENLGRGVHGIDLISVVDQEKVGAKEAWDEYEDIQRYVLYTQEELEENARIKAEQEAAQAKAAAREEFLNNAPERLDNTEITLDDLTLVVADLIAG